MNIATDLELALLAALGRDRRMLNLECKALSSHKLDPALDAVERAVIDKIEHFLQSGGYAARFEW